MNENAMTNAVAYTHDIIDNEGSIIGHVIKRKDDVTVYGEEGNFIGIYTSFSSYSAGMGYDLVPIENALDLDDDILTETFFDLSEDLLDVSDHIRDTCNLNGFDAGIFIDYSDAPLTLSYSGVEFTFNHNLSNSEDFLKLEHRVCCLESQLNNAIDMNNRLFEILDEMKNKITYLDSTSNTLGSKREVHRGSSSIYLNNTFDMGNTFVFMNGVKLRDCDYCLSGNGLSFNLPCNYEDIIIVESTI